MSDRIPLGAMVRDRYTGVSGVVVSRTEHLHGTSTVTVESVTAGDTVELYTYAEGRMVVEQSVGVGFTLGGDDE